MKKTKVALMTLAAACCHGQVAPVSLRVTVRQSEMASTVRQQSEAGRATPIHLNTGRIAAVNGQTAGGVWSARVSQFPTRRNVRLVRDSDPAARILTWSFSLTEVDGRSIGTITASASPDDVAVTDGIPITAGTGAYVGASGSVRLVDSERPLTQLRRKYEPPTLTFDIQLVPATTPTVIVSADGPAIMHLADSSLVTFGQPAQPDEVVAIYAINLAPEMDAEPDAWPTESKNLSGSPVHVSVAGLDAQIMSMRSVQGRPGVYELDVRVPTAVPHGIAELVIQSGFVGGPVASLSVQ